MTAAIDYLAQFGLAARKKGNRVVVSPRERVTADLQKYIRAHRIELLAELAANDGFERRCYWVVIAPGSRRFTMIAAPMTRSEATYSAKAIWPGALIE